MKAMKTIATLAALIVVGSAFGQDQGGPPPPGDQGGFGPGGPGGPGGQMRRGPGMGGPMILRMKEVQKELKLSDGQVSQVNAILPGPRPPQSGDDQGAPPRRLSREEMDAKVKSILSSDQFKRFQQLQLQAEGPRAFSRPEIQEKLGLSDTQKAKIQSILQSERQGPPPGDGQTDMRKAMKERRERLEQELTAVLTDDQKATWKSMTGAKFDFPMMGGPGGRRGFGGPGGGGPGGDGPGGPPPMDDQGGPPPPPPGGDGGQS